MAVSKFDTMIDCTPSNYISRYDSRIQLYKHLDTNESGLHFFSDQPLSIRFHWLTVTENFLLCRKPIHKRLPFSMKN